MRFLILFAVAVTLMLPIGTRAQDQADNDLARAVLLKKQKKYAKASELFRDIAKKKSAPSTVRAEAMYQLGRCLIADGKPAEANEAFSQLLAQFPKEAAVTAKILNDLESAREVLLLRRSRAAIAAANPFKETDAQKKIRRKLKEIVIKKVEFKDLTIQEALNFLHKQSKLNDPAKEGVNFLGILDPPEHAKKALEANQRVDLDEDDDDDAGKASPKKVKKKDIRIAASATNISLKGILEFLCQTAGMHYEIKNENVLVMPSGLTTKPFMTAMIYTDFGVGNDYKDFDFQSFYEDKGVSFPVRLTGEPAAIHLDRDTSQLVFRNTKANLELIKAIRRERNPPFPMVKVSAELFEIDIPPKMAATFRTTPTAELLLALPAGARNCLSKLVGSIQSGKETYLTDSYLHKDGAKAGKRTFVNQFMTFTPQVAEDGKVISVEIRWKRQLIPEAIMFKKPDGFDADMADYITETKEVRTELSIWDGASMVMQIAAADKANKKGALYLIITASIVDPDDKPRRDQVEADTVKEALKILLKEE